jgi:hypothetical protein
MPSTISLESTANRFPYLTARVTGRLADGTTSVGTGFFCKFNMDQGWNVPVLITNKHVVRDTQTNQILVHYGERTAAGEIVPKGAFATIELDGEKDWIMHPNGVDLAALPLANFLREAERRKECFFWRAINEALLPSEEQLSQLNAVEDVVMVGYPNGLWDEKNNFPLIRKGTTAFHPFHDFKGAPLGVVDIAAFPGSSGSPVLLYNSGTFATGNTIQAGNRVLLLGILSSGPTITAKGNLEIVDIPTSKVPIAKTELMMHLGYYIKARELLVLKQHLIASHRKREGGKPKQDAAGPAEPPALPPVPQ